MSSTGTAGRFTVTIGANGAADVVGPAAYLDSPSYYAFAKKLAAGQSVVVNAAPSGIPLATLIAVAIQTDFAAWHGARTMPGMGGGS